MLGETGSTLRMVEEKLQPAGNDAAGALIPDPNNTSPSRTATLTWSVWCCVLAAGGGSTPALLFK